MLWKLFACISFCFVLSEFPHKINCSETITRTTARTVAIFDDKQCNFVNSSRNASDSTVIVCESVLPNTYENFKSGLKKYKVYGGFIGQYHDLIALISQTLNIPYFVTSDVPPHRFTTMFQVSPSGRDIAKFIELFLNLYYNTAQSLSWVYELIGSKNTDVTHFMNYFQNFFLDSKLLFPLETTDHATIHENVDSWRSGKIILPDVYGYIFAPDGDIDRPLFQSMERLSLLTKFDTIFPFPNGLSYLPYIIRSDQKSHIFLYNNKIYSSKNLTQFHEMSAKSAYDHYEATVRNLDQPNYNRSSIIDAIINTETKDLSFNADRTRKCLPAEVYVIDSQKIKNTGVFDAVLKNDLGKAYTKIFDFCKERTEYKLIKRYPLSQIKQKVYAVGFNLQPFLSKASDTGQVYGWCYDVLHQALEVNLNFEIEWIFIDEEPYKSTYKSWNGLVQFIVEKKAHISAIPMLVTKLREEAVLFTKPYTSTAFAVMETRESSDNVPIVYRPFSLILWLFIAGINIFMALGLWFMELVYSCCIPASKKKGTLSDLIFELVGSLFSGKPPVMPGLFVKRFVFLIVDLFAILLMAHYLAALHAQLANPVDLEVPIKNISSLVNNSNVRYFFLEDSEFVNLVKSKIGSESQDETIDVYNQALSGWPDEAVVRTFQDVRDRFNGSSTKEYFIDMIEIINRFTYSTCLYRMTQANYYQYLLSFAMEKDWPYAEQFDSQLFKLSEMGVVQKYIIANEEINIPCKEETGTVSLLKFSGTFYLAALGVACAIIMIILEVIVRQVKLCHQRKRNLGAVKFGKIYKCKVTSLENNGVWAKVTKGMDVMFFPIKNLVLDHKSDVKTSPLEMGMVVGSTIEMMYLGNDPKRGTKIFRRINA